MSTFREALAGRRSCYELTPDCPLNAGQVEEILSFAMLNVPSPFNSQSTRLVLLAGPAYARFWELVLEALRPLVPSDRLDATKAKLRSFAAGAGTILFYEDQAVVEKLMADFPGYKDNFPIWSQQACAMHQLAVWTMLEDAGCGASLQHYNPVVDALAAKEWKIDPQWKLVAQMPYGGVRNKPAKPEKAPLDGRLVTINTRM